MRTYWRAALAAFMFGATAFTPVTQPALPGQMPDPAPDTIEKLTDFIFDTQLNTSARTRALLYRDRGYHFRTFDEIRTYNITSAHSIEGTAQAFDLDERPSESPYWSWIESPDGATDFIRRLSSELEVELQQPSPRPPGNRAPLEKAIAGRNLFQIFNLVYRAREISEDAAAQAMAQRIERVVAVLFASMRLSDSEYRKLSALRPARLPPGFTSRASLSLEENYLPKQVLREDSSWMSIAGDGRRTRHFRAYGGRAFVRVFVRAPGMDHRQLETLWTELHALYGERLHEVAIDQDVPAGLETLLVRTLGVFLADGTFRDSKWPEEVIIRQFKYPRPQIDNSTSDFRGTLFFQYRLSMELLLRQPESLGLRRVRDDDIQYFGFLGDVADIHHSYSDTVTTMRSNCIACHSELFYGLSTVFSFERDPHLMNTRAGDESMAKLVSPGTYRLQTDAYRRLQSLLGGTAAAD